MKNFPVLFRPKRRKKERERKAILILAFHNENPELYMGIIKTKKIKNNKKAGPISVGTGH